MSYRDKCLELYGERRQKNHVAHSFWRRFGGSPDTSPGNLTVFVVLFEIDIHFHVATNA